jgi:hypothetical protein
MKASAVKKANAVIAGKAASSASARLEWPLIILPDTKSPRSHLPLTMLIARWARSASRFVPTFEFKRGMVDMKSRV